MTWFVPVSDDCDCDICSEEMERYYCKQHAKTAASNLGKQGYRFTIDKLIKCLMEGTRTPDK
jgi:hypothetical protein